MAITIICTDSNSIGNIQVSCVVFGDQGSILNLQDVSL